MPSTSLTIKPPGVGRGIVGALCNVGPSFTPVNSNSPDYMVTGTSRTGSVNDSEGYSAITRPWGQEIPINAG